MDNEDRRCRAILKVNCEEMVEKFLYSRKEKRKNQAKKLFRN